MAPDTEYLEFRQTPQPQPHTQIGGILDNEKSKLSPVEQDALALIEEATSIARGALTSYEDDFYLSGVLVDHTNARMADSSLNCMPFGYVATPGLSAGVPVVVTGLGFAIVDVAEPNGIKASSYVPRLKFTSRLVSSRDPEVLNYIEATFEELYEYIFLEKPLFNLGQGGCAFAGATTAHFKEMLTAQDANISRSVIAKLRKGLNHAFAQPHSTYVR